MKQILKVSLLATLASCENVATGVAFGADPPPTPKPTPPDPGLLDKMIAKLEAVDSKGIFLYQTPTNKWLPSTLYTWKDMIEGVKIMASQGIGSQKLFVGEGSNFNYGMVNLAAFLGECMKETIMYNACDENNWSNPAVTHDFGGTPYTAAYACGQGGQSYQDYKCSAGDDKIAGGKMACDIDNTMEMRAHTQAVWYGAPAKMFCAPKSRVPKAPKWNYASPWCPAKGGWHYIKPFPNNMTDLGPYWDYVNKGGSCRDYDPIKTGGWDFCGGKGCASCPAPVFNRTGRTDTEGCCWYGRGIIQTSGICNFGKLNYYMGKRGHDNNRTVLYPDFDFCKDPELICKPDSPAPLKWIAGFFYWLNDVQSYKDKDGWEYMAQLKNWTDSGMKIADKSFINACSGIVNRGCYNPPCGGNAMDGGAQRAANFATVMAAMKIGAVFEEDEDMEFYIRKYQEAAELPDADNKNHWARDNIPKELLDIHVPQPIYRHVADDANKHVEPVYDQIEDVEKTLQDTIEQVEGELVFSQD